MKGYYDCGYDLLMQGVDPNDNDEWDEDEHPINCICPECSEWAWYENVTTGRLDPLDDENWEPPF